MRAAAVTLDENPNDIPFALVYLLADDGRTAWLAETVRLENGSAAAPDEIELNSEGDVWRFRQVLETGQSQTIENLDDKFGQLFAREWGADAIKKAVALPLAKAGIQEYPAGFLVAGISSRLTLNDDYRSFLELAAGRIATAIANARAHEEERKRAEALAEIDRAAPPDNLPSISGARVLLVDDDADGRDLVETMLDQGDAETRTAGSAAAALAMLDEWRPDALISDIGMPGEDGYALIEKLRERERERGERRLPAIALTAYARVEDRLRALSAGYQAHVSKPVQMSELFTVIASLLNRSDS